MAPTKEHAKAVWQKWKRNNRDVYLATKRRWYLKYRDSISEKNKAMSQQRVWDHRAYYQKYPEKLHARSLKHNYGMSLDDYKRMLSEQDERCIICRIHHSECRQGKLQVDHCHERDRVRGLLCEHCNRMLGLAKEKPDTLIAAATYLRERGGKNS